MLRKRRIARDAKTGKIVTLAYAEKHPNTTVVETIQVKASAPPAKKAPAKKK